MKRILLPALLLLAALPAQTPPPASSLSIQISNGPGAAFQFGKGDLRFLDGCNQIDAAFEQRGLVLHDPGVQAYIDSIGSRVLGNRSIPEKVTYRFLVLRDPLINSYSYCNGSVYVTTGLLSVLDNEAQLASVLAHETAHVYERHGYLENRSVGNKDMAMEILWAAANWVPGNYGLAALAGTRLSSVLVKESIAGYSRGKEREADRDGIAAMAATGYNPHEMAATFEIIEQSTSLEYEPRPNFYLDHPRFEERETAAIEFAKSYTPPGAYTGSERDYLAAVAPAIADNVQSGIGSRNVRSAVAGATRLTHTFPQESQYQMLLGEAYRALGAETAQPTAEELTEKGENQQRKLAIKMSQEQEQQKLLLKPEGRAALEQNRAAAEQAFLAAIHLQPDLLIVYRELGFLYEDEGRYADAASNYRRYLAMLPPSSLDRYRIERRISAIEGRQSAAPH